MSNKTQREKISVSNKKLVTTMIKRGHQLPQTRVYDFADLSDEDLEPSYVQGETSVEMRDLKTDECAILYHRMYADANADADIVDNDNGEPIVAIHNFASRFHCGGGYVRGARAQEEDLCRVIPELYPSMKKSAYPHGETTVWITPNVKIMRGSDNYSILNENQQIPVTVVSAAAPALSRNREKWDPDRVRNTLINIMVSVKKNCPKINTLVLGAFGCGAYHNDPKKISNIMNEVIQEYGGLYERIVISIPNGRDNNYNTFESIIDTF